MFEKTFLPFIKNYDSSATIKRDPLDECMLSYFEKFKKFENVKTMHDFELAPNRRPKILVQTAGHVSGAVRFYQASDIKNNRIKPDKKLYPVCLHPQYGGWFALRGVVIFERVTVPNLVRLTPPDILKTSEEISHLLELYNDHWRDWRFRDVIPVQEKYSGNQRTYFELPPGEKRSDFIKSLLENP